MSGVRSTQALLFSAMILIARCSAAQAAKGETEKLYDFDEKVHYYQTKLADGRYHLEIQSMITHISKIKASFYCVMLAGYVRTNLLC